MTNLQILTAAIKSQHADCIKQLQAATTTRDVISLSGECRGIQSVITRIRISQRSLLTRADIEELQLLEDALRAEQLVAQEKAYSRILNQEAANDF